MRITQEADYAIRICCILAEKGYTVGAQEVADFAAVTKSSADKVLKILVKKGIVLSFKGAQGGYKLSRCPGEMTVLDILEAVDGETVISKCLYCDHPCGKNPNKSACKMHTAFAVINRSLREDFRKITVRMLTDPTVQHQEIQKILNRQGDLQQ